MPEQTTGQVAHTTRTARPDALSDLANGSIALPGGGRIDYTHPRAAMAVLYETNFDATEEYPPYWAEVWPSGVELARAVAGARSRTGADLTGANVLELGCGLGLPSIAAAMAGAKVLATDRSPDGVAFAADNARRSGVSIETAACSWSDPAALLGRAPWDLVLAADVLYGHRNVAELLDLLPRLVGRGGEVWLADPGRPLTGEFLDGARVRWGSVSTLATVPTVNPVSSVDAADTADPVLITVYRLRGPR
ncbi:MAG: methyltransferase domain-containing protein [Pseudonocardia sp.]|nr:methyltransferase domain-containing protein [Pseudonocardia sp.]